MGNKYFYLTIKKIKMMFLINNLVMEHPKNSPIYKFHKNCRCSDFSLSKMTVFTKNIK